jgi:putative DNA primase/helicase
MKSILVSFNTDFIPEELRAVAQWVCWRVEIRNEKPTKIPVSPRTGGNASVTDPSTWGTFKQAVAAALKRGERIGFVFAEVDPFSGVDLDGCRDPRTGSIAAWAMAIIRRINSYTEVSPSGTGVKIFIRGRLIGASGRRRGPVEIYSAKRFFCVTGQRIDDVSPHVEHRQRELDALVSQLWPPRPTGERTRTTAPVSADDDELIRRACRARNGDAFERLWNGDWSAYSSQSEADAALCSHLAFWTGNDAERIGRLFERSGLVRPKWTARDDYRQRTIERGLH